MFLHTFIDLHREWQCCSVTADSSRVCKHTQICVDLLAQLVPGKIEGPEPRALPLTGGWECCNVIPTQPQRDQSLMGGSVGGGVRYHIFTFSFQGIHRQLAHCVIGQTSRTLIRA